MLEEKVYTKAEISKILQTTDNQGIKRKLNNYGVEYSCFGRGDNLQIHITKIPSMFRFRVFCITELNIPAQTDFKKFRDFLYYFMNDEDFRWLPDETLAIRMAENEALVSRPTITNYKRHLQAANLLSLTAGDEIYYFAKNKQQRIADREEYISAWREYWENKAETGNAQIAAQIMQERHGGMARKQHIAAINGINLSVWNKLNDLVCESMKFE